jgi:hypothetical protein
MSNARSTFLPRLHSLVQHSGDLAAFLTESGLYTPLSYYEQWHWQNEVNKKLDLFALSGISPRPYPPIP